MLPLSGALGSSSAAVSASRIAVAAAGLQGVVTFHLGSAAHLLN